MLGVFPCFGFLFWVSAFIYRSSRFGPVFFRHLFPLIWVASGMSK